MRKITQLAAGAFARGENFKRDNTEVRRNGLEPEQGLPPVDLLLHGHRIARRRSDGCLDVSMCGWGTPTTRERLDAALPLGLGICQRKGRQYWSARGPWCHYDGQEVNPYATYTVCPHSYYIGSL